MSLSALEIFLKPDRVLLNVHAGCKREALQEVAKVAAKAAGKPSSEIISAIFEREQLGSTAVGDGVAIPHGKIADLKEIIGVLARLEKPVEFDAMDEQPVDIIFMLLAPENATAAHLKALAKVSRFLRDADAVAALRGAESTEAVYAIAVDGKHHHAA